MNLGSYNGDGNTSRTIYPNGSGTLIGMIITKPGKNMGVVAPFIKGNTSLIYDTSTSYSIVSFGTSYISFSGLTTGSTGNYLTVNESGYTYYYLAFWN